MPFKIIALILILKMTSYNALAQAQSHLDHIKDAPGKWYHFKPEDMPKPYATRSVARLSQYQTRTPDQIPDLPPKFTATLLIENIPHPRHLVSHENGAIFVAQSGVDSLALIQDSDNDGVADGYAPLPQKFDTPHGLDIDGNLLYIADLNGIWRIDLNNISKPAQRLTPAGALGGSGGHWTRNIALSPDKTKIYAAIGSEGNIGEEPLPRATIKEFTFDQNSLLNEGTIYATGLRNPVGIQFHPDTKKLYTVVNERDGMGDGLVPDYMTEVVQDGFYGWPYAYIGQHEQPEYKGKHPEKVAISRIPEILFQSHSAPLGLTFLHNANVPNDWKDDALVALHGSWNSSRPTGYKVVRIEFENGTATGRYQDFATGFRLFNEEEKRDQNNGGAIVWARPAGVAVRSNGDILISDDRGNSIWTIKYNP